MPSAEVPLLHDTLSPSIVSLFDSTSSSPLAAACIHLDAELPQDSGAALLNDSSDLRSPFDHLLSCPELQLRDDNSAPSRSVTSEERLRRLDQVVLHLQSPTLATTYLSIPPRGSKLGLQLPFLHFQLRPLGGRPFSIEAGILDPAGRSAVIRASTFQTRPVVRASLASASAGETTLVDAAPLLHLPLSFASDETSAVTLTSWLTISLPLRKLASRLHDPSLLSTSNPTGPHEAGRQALPPFGGFASIEYVRVYASCRIRRIWASSASDRDVGGERIAELGVYG